MSGLLGGPSMGWQQGMPNLLTGYVPPQGAVLQSPQQGLLSQLGPWSQTAYNLAGKPVQGPYPTIPGPTAIPGSLSSSGSGGSTGSAAGSLAGGLLAAAARNPNLIKAGVNGVQGLLGSGIGSSVGAAASQTAAGLAGMPVASIAGAGGLLGADGALTGATLAPIGTGAVDAATAAATADAAAATGGASSGAASAAGSGLGSMSAAQVGGAVAAPIALYSEIKNWESGATGKDALGGAATGAAIGTAIMPGIGTAIGAIGGAIVGGISSLFGGGRVDPENVPFEKYTQAFNKADPTQQSQVAAAVSNPYLPLAGYFDLRSDQLKGNNPLYQSYGRQGEQKFTNDLIGKVQQGQQAGITDSTQMWNQVVNPWLNSFGSWNDSNKGALLGLMQNMTGQVMAGTYQQNFKAVGGDSPYKSATPSTSAARSILRM